MLCALACLYLCLCLCLCRCAPMTCHSMLRALPPQAAQGWACARLPVAEHADALAMGSGISKRWVKRHSMQHAPCSDALCRAQRVAVLPLPARRIMHAYASVAPQGKTRTCHVDRYAGYAACVMTCPNISHHPGQARQPAALCCRRPVLNVDDVVLALLSFHAHGCWRGALDAALPRRKRRVQESRPRKNRVSTLPAAAAAAAASGHELRAAGGGSEP